MSDKPEHVGVDSKTAVERDRIDLNHEIAAEPTGRIPRFLTENHHTLYGGENEKQKSERRYRTMLQILLEEDVQYARLYYEVRDTLNNARRAVDRALSDIKRQLEEAERTLQFMRNNAARIDDGTLVFRSTVDGHVYTEDGRQLSADEAQDIEFSENAPSREDFNTQREKAQTLKEQQAEIETYKRDVIDRAQDRMDDKDDPPSVEELEKIEQDIQTKKPAILSQYFYQERITANKPGTRNVAAAHDITGRSPLEMPPMSSQFDKARLDIPDLEVFSVAGNNPTIAPAV